MKSNESQNAQIAHLVQQQRDYTKREMNGHIRNVHHGLNQLESYLYGDGDLRNPSINSGDSIDWKDVIREVFKQSLPECVYTSVHVCLVSDPR